LSSVISHVADQRRFVERVAGWVRPGGAFLLMTQNAFVWSRSSYLSPPGAGQIRDWPSLRRLRGLLAPWFTIRHVSTIVPGGDRGILRVANHRLVKGLLRRMFGGDLTTRLYERGFVGRELVLVAERKWSGRDLPG
jgi:2-polyprenyl-3-methyl-5-hydroxy-6-metoxy-1,4-benzoquinol methylase